MPRDKYNPHGPNHYTPVTNPDRQLPRGPRHDLRQKHKIKDDPLDKIDKKLELASEEVIEDKEKEAAKKLARKFFAATKKEEENSRDGIETFKFQDNGIKSVANVYKFLAQAFMNLVKANNVFAACKSSQISPDGKLGGKGYIKPIKEIREDFSVAVNILSELIDTFHDEINSPYWKKTTIEDNPIVKEILSEADQIIDKAEEIEDKKGTSPELSKEEKEKVKAILKSKKWF